MVTQQSAAETSATQTNEYDVVIVGAGIAGPALAVALGNQGRKVLVVERDLSEPDRIVGELLQPGGVAALKTLGLGSCIEDIDAIPCQGYNVIYSGEECVLKYPKVPETSSRTTTSCTEAESLPTSPTRLPEEYPSTTADLS